MTQDGTTDRDAEAARLLIASSETRWAAEADAIPLRVQEFLVKLGMGEVAREDYTPEVAAHLAQIPARERAVIESILGSVLNGNPEAALTTLNEHIEEHMAVARFMLDFEEFTSAFTAAFGLTMGSVPPQATSQEAPDSLDKLEFPLQPMAARIDALLPSILHGEPTSAYELARRMGFKEERHADPVLALVEHLGVIRRAESMRVISTEKNPWCCGAKMLHAFDGTPENHVRVYRCHMCSATRPRKTGRAERRYRRGVTKMPTPEEEARLVAAARRVAGNPLIKGKPAADFVEVFAGIGEDQPGSWDALRFLMPSLHKAFREEEAAERAALERAMEPPHSTV